MTVSITKPIVGSSTDTWAATLNVALDAIVAEVNSVETGSVTLDTNVEYLIDSAGNFIKVLNYLHGLHNANHLVGRWYPGVSTSTNLTTVANHTYLIPYPIYSTSAWDMVGVNISAMTAGSSGTLRYGLWKDTGNIYPGAFVSEVQASAAIAAVGSQNTAIGWTIGPPGLYWLGVNAQSATVQPVIIGAAATLGQIIFGASNSGNSGTGLCYEYSTAVTGTFTALGANFPAGATINTTATPHIQMRAA